MSKEEQWQDPRWQKKRLEIMERDSWKCLNCGSEKSTLNVHHIVYEKGRPPWHYPNKALLTLCNNCHKEAHTMTFYFPSNVANKMLYFLLDYEILGPLV